MTLRPHAELTSKLIISTLYHKLSADSEAAQFTGDNKPRIHL